MLIAGLDAADQPVRVPVIEIGLERRGSSE
jgi:hypothetical protein